MGFFDLVNSISIKSEIFVTNNQVILNIRDKIIERVKDLKIYSVQEFDDYLKKNQLKPEISKPNYTG